MSNRSSFVPNSFQTPNVYVDYVMPYLTGEEYKVLHYATRRILGFQKRQDRISLSQFTDGTRNNKGKILDRGTGLSVETVKKCLSSLVSFGLMVRVAENDPRTNEGTLWGLQWDGRKVAWKALEKRGEDKSELARARISKARSMRQTPLSGIEGGSTSDIENPPTSGTETQYTEDTQGKPEEEDAQLTANIETLKTLHEQNVGFVTPLLMNMLRNASLTYPADWFQPAFEIMVKSAKHRSWAFVEAVLEGWKKNGYGWKPTGNGRKPTQPQQPPAEDDNYLAELEATRARLRAQKGNRVSV